MANQVEHSRVHSYPDLGITIIDAGLTLPLPDARRESKGKKKGRKNHEGR